MCLFIYRKIAMTAFEPQWFVSMDYMSNLKNCSLNHTFMTDLESQRGDKYSSEMHQCQMKLFCISMTLPETCIRW